jgi:polyisoprenoid-binding protein YceI
MSEHTATGRVLHGRLLPPAGVYALDPVHTFVEFSVQHMVVGRVVGHFADTEGTITLPEDPAGMSLEVTVTTTGVNTHNEMRDEDLRSARFFDVARHPVMTYRGAATPGSEFTRPQRRAAGRSVCSPISSVRPAD